MIGALIGDTVGSVYEFHNIKTKEFPLINKYQTLTDDSIMTFAILDCLENNILDDRDIALTYKKWVNAYPNRGYGGMFHRWAISDSLTGYNSYGNGSAMRTSPIGWYSRSEEEVIELATKFSSITHNHPLGIKGAVVTSMCIYYARIGKSKEFIRDYIYNEYPITKELDYDDLVKNYKFNEICNDTVPQALYCFLISKDFIDCLRTTISIGGDSDTLAAISCSVAEAFYKDIDKELIKSVLSKVPSPRMGCETYELLSKFIEKKTLESVYFEEIKENSNVLVVESDDKVNLFHSMSIVPLREYIIYFELKDSIKNKYPDLKIESLNEYDLDYLVNELKKLNMDNLIEIIKKIDNSVSFSDFKKALKDYNNLFSSNKLFLYSNPKDALNYIKENYQEYSGLAEEILNKIYYKNDNTDFIIKI